jgi:membrane fusion protein, multidrug efflux system
MSTAPPSVTANATTAKPHSSRKTWALIAAALALLAWGAHWMYQRSIHVYLDDARIDGEVITLSSRVSGWLTELPVIEGDEVKKGQTLARIDERDSVLMREVLAAKLQAIESQMAVMRAQTGQVDQETLGRVQSESNRLAAAEAEAANLSSQVKHAESENKRMQSLEKYVSGQEIDQASNCWCSRARPMKCAPK